MSTADHEPGVAFPATARAPVFLTTLVGRVHHVEQVAALLRTARLVTLVGVGGSGKTRLAAGVAAALADEVSALGWIDLVPITEPDLVASHVASSLGLREHLSRNPVEALSERIGTSTVLLVLDNCEHLRASCEELAGSLLRNCAGLRILATSREPLRLPGEKAWRVPPLEVPGADDATARDAAAVQLFAERAGDTLPGFALTDAVLPAVARICRRVGGLPLAVELAAARIAVLPAEQLADRLDDMFRVLTSRSASMLPRQRTLRGMMDWSYELLSGRERRLFDGLAVFAGGFTLDAAERILGEHGCVGQEDEVLDVLAALVEKSLVVMRESGGEARYSLLEPVRQYATERLQQHPSGAVGADAIHLNHAMYYTALAEQLTPDSVRRNTQGFARLETDHDNLQAALAWTLAHGRTDLTLRLCCALRDFWRVRGHLRVGLAWTRRAVDASRGDATVERLRTRALVAAAVYARMAGEYISLQEWLAEAVSSARALDDLPVLAEALTQQSVSLRDRRVLDQARLTADESIGLWRGLGDVRGLATALGARASVSLAEGDTALARSLRTEAADLARAAGDEEAESYALIGLGEVARMQGDLDHARWCNEQCLALFLRAGDAWHAAAARHNLGWIEAQAGNFEAALEAFASIVSIFRSVGNPFGLTLCLFGFARLLFRADDVESAGVILAAASVHAARVGVRPAAPADIAAYEETAAGIERTLSSEAHAAAAARGAALSLAGALGWAEARLRELQAKAAAADTTTAGPAPATPLLSASQAPGADPAAGPDTAPAALAGARIVPSSAVPAAATTASFPLGEPDLQVLALGPLQVVVAGRPVAGDVFGSSRPKELLLLLLCHPDGLSRDQVGLAFWPDASAAQVKNSFHVVLHRLRRGLGESGWVMLEGERYRIHRKLRVDFDVHRFQAEMAAALRDTSPHRTARLSAALAIYRGDFLEGSAAGDWHLELRDRLHRLCCDGLLALGDSQLGADRLDDAAAAYRALLARDPLREEAYRGLMICQARSGQRVQALQLYEMLSLLLRDELGTQPDSATTALHDLLQRGQPL
jgi:predicted ATPase/DNA-binding SARP family transcriptional activator